MNISEQIRSHRKELGLTQEQVAAYLGVSAPAVNKWEKGNTYPEITLLPAIAKTMGNEGISPVLQISAEIIQQGWKSLCKIPSFRNQEERRI